MIIVSRRGLSRKLDSSNHSSESTGLFALRDIVFNGVVSMSRARFIHEHEFSCEKRKRKREENLETNVDL